MAKAIHCSFCGQPKGKVLELVLARRAPSPAAICDECVAICRKILVKSATAPIVETPRSYYRVGALEPERNQLICSFCGTSQQEAHRLIGATPKLPHAFICDQCVQRCEATIGSGSTTPVRDWLARRTGRHDTTIHHIG